MKMVCLLARESATVVTPCHRLLQQWSTTPDNAIARGGDMICQRPDEVIENV
jgi:hypothetical protein